LIKEKRRLVNWLTDMTDNEFNCFPESIESIHITSKHFYDDKEGDK
jgi:hypothetical protein